MRLFGIPALFVLLLLAVAVPTSQAVVDGKPALKKTKSPATTDGASPASASGGDGAQIYAPTRCEWLAIELNANFRESYPRSGFTSQFYCHAPNTIFLSFHYIKEEFKAAADEADDQIRDAIGRVMLERKWTWVKVDDEVVKGDLPAWPPPAVSVLKKPLPPKKSEEEDDSNEEKPKDDEAPSTDETAESPAPGEVASDSTPPTKPQPWVHMRHPEIEFQKKLEEQDRQQAKLQSSGPKTDPVAPASDSSQ